MATPDAPYIEITSVTKTSNSQNTPGTSVALKHFDPNGSDSIYVAVYNLKRLTQWLPGQSNQTWNSYHVNAASGYGAQSTNFQIFADGSTENADLVEGEFFSASEITASVAVLFKWTSKFYLPPVPPTSVGEDAMLATSRLWVVAPSIEPQTIPTTAGGIFSGHVVGTSTPGQGLIAFYFRNSSYAGWQLQSSQRALHTGYFAAYLPPSPSILAIFHPAGTDESTLGNIPDDLNQPITVQAIYQTGLAAPETSKAATLNGNSLRTQIYLPQGENVTVEAWVRLNGQTSVPLICLLGQPGNMLSLSWRYDETSSSGETVNSGLPRGDLVLNVASSNGQVKQLTGSGALSLADGSWHHVAAVLHSEDAWVYLDGRALRATDTANTNFSNLLASGVYTAGIGMADPSMGSITFDGCVDEVRVWSCARTRVQITGCMYRSLTGNENGLVAYWPFEGSQPLISLAKPTGQGPILSAFPAYPLVTYTSDTVGFSPLLQPYVVGQCKLMLDPLASTPGSNGTPANNVDTYRVIIRAYTGEGTPMAFTRLTLYSERDDVRYFDNQAEATLSASGKTVYANAAGEFTLAFYTNSALSRSGNMPLRAPLLKVSTDFMAPGEGLLISPDRHLHYRLTNITADQIQAVLPNPGNSASIAAMASAVNQLGAACADLDLQSNHPVLRNLGDTVDTAAQRTASRLYQNVMISRSGYDPMSDVSTSALHEGSMTGATTAPVRIAAIESMPLSGWSITLDGPTNTWSFSPSTSAEILSGLSDSDVISSNEATQELLARVFSSKQAVSTVVTMPRQTMLRAFNLTTADRRGTERLSLSSLWDDACRLGDEIKAAAVTIVDDVLGVPYQALSLFVHIADKWVTEIVSAVDDILDFAQSALTRVSVSGQDMINAVKAIWNWDNVLYTKEVLASAVSLVQQSLSQTLITAGDIAKEWLTTQQQQIHTNIENASQYFANNGLKLGVGAQMGSETQPLSTDAALIPMMATTYLPQSTCDIVDESGSSTLPSKIQDKLQNLSNKVNNKYANFPQEIEGLINGHTGILNLCTNPDELLDVLIYQIIDVMEEVVDSACAAISGGIDLLCGGLEDMLEILRSLMNQPINIPVLSTLYRNWVDPGNDLTIGNLLLLVGAAPATVVYAGTHDGTGPFTADDVKAMQKMDVQEFLRLAHRSSKQRSSTAPQAIQEEAARSSVAFDVVDIVMWALDFLGLLGYSVQILLSAIVDTAAMVAIGAVVWAPGSSLITEGTLWLLKLINLVVKFLVQLVWAPLTWFYEINKNITTTAPETMFGVVWLSQFLLYLLDAVVLWGTRGSGTTSMVGGDLVTALFYFFHGVLLFFAYIALVVLYSIYDNGALNIITDVLNSVGGIFYSLTEVFQLSKVVQLFAEVGLAITVAGVAGLLPSAVDILCGTIAWYLWLGGSSTGLASSIELTATA